jgi:CBS domain-containing protein
MRSTPKPLLDLTAADLMTSNLLRLTERMPLREAARLLLENQVSGAPVVDANGKCVGVLSAIDFVRMAVRPDEHNKPCSRTLPLTCSFQTKRRVPDGDELICCNLPYGACAVQMPRKGPNGEDIIVCSQPHCVMADCQVVEIEKLPTDAVRHYMTADPVTVPVDASLRVLTRLMIDAHIHRVIVVDEQATPVGIVSSSDILGAVAYAEEDQVKEGWNGDE